MLLNRQERERIVREGHALLFRRWRRPTVKSGGSLRTAVGVLAVDSVTAVDPAAISETDAIGAGHRSAAHLLAALSSRGDGAVYRIALRLAGPDPREALRDETRIDADAMTRSLQRLDARGAWTRAYLKLIAAHPGRRAAELADTQCIAMAVFKRNVRKLKELGLTESLEVGYRLSPRGQAVIELLGDEAGT